MPAGGGGSVGEHDDVVAVDFTPAPAVAEDIGRARFGGADAVAFVELRGEVATSRC